MSEITEELNVKEASSTAVVEEEVKGRTTKKVSKLPSSLKYRYFSGEERRNGKRWFCLAQAHPPFKEKGSTKVSSSSASSHGYIKNLVERNDFYASDCNSHRDQNISNSKHTKWWGLTTWIEIKIDTTITTYLPTCVNCEFWIVIDCWWGFSSYVSRCIRWKKPFNIMNNLSNLHWWEIKYWLQWD